MNCKFDFILQFTISSIYSGKVMRSIKQSKNNLKCIKVNDFMKAK